jgi:nitrite reductase (NADH) large subunit
VKRLIVIGNGMAGGRLLEELVARGAGERYAITVFGEEPGGCYNRILLSDVLNGARDAGDIWLNPLEWYGRHGITLHAGDRVTAIDRDHGAVRSASGQEVEYDHLVLATGSRPFVPPLEGLRLGDGSEKPGVFVFRTLEDCRRIAGWATKSRRAVVIGGGLLGLEAARGLVEHGVEVHVVHQAGHLMNQQLDAESGAMLAARIRAMGIHLHLDCTTVGVDGQEQVTGLRFADGETLAGDMVVVACGVRANVELAQECGLAVDRALVVDDRLRSVSDPAISGVGECIQHRGLTYGLVAPLWEQAAVLADTLTGGARRYAGSKTVTRLKVMGIELSAMGAMEAEAEDDEIVRFSERTRGVYKKLIVRQGRLAGAILLGDAARAPYLIQAFDRGTPVPEERAALLFDLGGAPRSHTLEEMTDDSIVCHCNQVCKGDIAECVRGGGDALSAVMRVTRAGTGCGSCKSLLREIITRSRPRELAVLG